MSDADKKVVVINDALSALEFSLQALVEAIAGIASSDKKEWALSLGYLLQRVRGGNFLRQLAEEFKAFRDKGRIKDDFIKSEQCLTCLQEVIELVDKDAPDEVRFSAMKDLFLGIAFEILSKREDVAPAQLMRICRSLNSAEVLVLAANYRLCKKETWQETMRQRGRGTNRVWITECLAESGLRFEELVLECEQSLQSKRLLSPSHFPDRSAFEFTQYYRLTEMGFSLCKLIHLRSDPT